MPGYADDGKYGSGAGAEHWARRMLTRIARIDKSRTIEKDDK